MSFDAGDIVARATVDRTEFEAALDDMKAKADAFAAGTYEPKLDAETRALDGKLDSTKAKLDEIGRKDEIAHVGVDDEAAKAKLDELQLRLDALQSKASLARVDLNSTAAKRKVSDIQQALGDLQNQTFGTGINPAGLERISADADTLEKRLEGVNNELDRTASKADSASKAAGGLAGAAIALAPALADVGGVGLATIGAGLAALPAVAAGGVEAFGALKLGLSGLGGALSAANAQQNAQTVALQSAGGPAATVTAATRALTQANQQQALAFANLTPAGQDFVTFLEGSLVPAFNNLKANVQGALLPDLEAGLKAAGPAVQVLGAGFVQAAGGIGQTVKEIGQFLGQGEGLVQFNGLLSNGNHLFDLLGGAAETAFKAVVSIGSQSGPIINEIGKLANEAANAFDRWANDGGFQRFLTYLRTNGPLVAHTIADIASVVKTLATDAAATGPVLLQIVDAAAQLAGDLLSLSPALDSVAIGIASVGLGANKLLGPLGGLSGAFNDVRAGVAGFTTGELTALTVGADGAAVKLTGAQKAVGGLGVAARDAVLPILAADGAMASLGAAADLALGPVGLVVLGVSALTAALVLNTGASKEAKTAGDNQAQGFVQQTQALGLSTDQQESLIQRQINSLHDQEKALSAAGKANQSFVGQIGLGLSVKSDPYQKLAASASSLQGALDSMRASAQGAKFTQDQLAASLEQMVAPMTQAQMASQALSYAQAQLGTDTGSASSALSAFNAEVAALIGNNQSAQKADLGLEGSIQSFATTLAASQQAIATAKQNVASAQQAVNAAVSSSASQHASLTTRQANASNALATAQNNYNAALNATKPNQTTILNSQNSLATAQNNYNAALSGASPAQQAIATAQQNLAKNQLALNAALAAAKDPLSETSALGLKVRDSYSQIGSQISQVIAADVKAGQDAPTIRAQIQARIDQFDTEAKKAGFTADQITALKTQYGLLPSDVTTQLTLDGANKASDGAKKVKGDVNNVVGTYTATLTADPSGVITGVNAAQHALGQFMSYSVNTLRALHGDINNTVSTSGPVTGNILPHAAGGIIPAAASGTILSMHAAAGGFSTNSPTLLVGEGGPHSEFIIPTDPKYHARAMTLTGQLLAALGTTKMAEGGTTDKSLSLVAAYRDMNPARTGSSGGVTVSVGDTHISVQGSSNPEMTARAVEVAVTRSILSSLTLALRTGVGS